MTLNRRIKVFAGDFVGKGHTISQLARFSAKGTKEQNLEVIILSANQKKYGKTDSAINREFQPENRSSNDELNVFHIGNNVNSLPVYKALTNSIAKTNIVILHDIYLGNLLAAILKEQILKNAELRLQEVLGISDYLLFILQNNSPNEADQTIRARLAVKILNVVIPKGSKIVHAPNQLYEKELRNYDEIKNLHILDLPIGFHEIEGHRAKKIEYDLVISGHASPQKKTSEILSQIENIAHEKQLKILIVGSICRQIKSELPRFSHKLDVKFVEVCTDEEWDSFHYASKIGIRLGVGMQGEKSGTVRDYLVYGLQVISDEKSEHLEKLTNFNFFEAQDDLGEFLTHILQKTLPIDGDHRVSNVRQYYEHIFTLDD